MLTSMSVVTPIKRNCTVRLLPSVIEQETSFFQKIQILDKSFCCNEDKNESVCFSSTVRLIQRENTAFAIRPLFPGSQKHVPLQFQSCVKTLIGNTVPFHKKIGQGRVFFECWLPYLSLHWLVKHYCQVTSQQEAASSLYFLKLKT